MTSLSMEYKIEPWKEYQGREAKLYTVTFRNGFEVSVSDFGATLVRVRAPSKTREAIDVCFFHNDPESYTQQEGYFGAIVGRVANRIANARFTLNGQEYSLFANDNGHCLHGGKQGFNVKWWELIEEHETHDTVKLTFRYISEDGEENFPGKLTTNITYTITPNKLEWEFEAETDKTTIINLTNHAYWNLEGVDGKLIDDQLVTLDSDNYMPVDATLIPTGELIDLYSHEISMKFPIEFSKIFAKFGDVDHNFMLGNHNPAGKETRFAAELYSPKTGS